VSDDDAEPGPETTTFQRPPWMLPVAILGALLIIIGIVLTVDWSDGDEPPIPITGTTTTVAPTSTVSGG